MTMAQLTVRGVPEDVKEYFERRARREGLSVNRVVLNQLCTAAAADEKQARVRAAVARLAGSWTTEEIAEFKERLAEMRQVDEEMWHGEAAAGHVSVHQADRAT
jgi:plasmid stability protein